VLLALLAAASGCFATPSAVGGGADGPAASAAPADAGATTTASAAAPAPPPTSTVPSGRARDPRPVEEAIGRLRTSKGMLEVGSLLMGRDEVAARLGADWQRALERRVRVRGHRRDHVCDPQEQCLVQGVLRLLEDLESVELCRSPGRAPQGTADCPVGAEELSLCMADCKQQSDACDAASRGGQGMGLKRCGCAFVSCKRACTSHGEPDFGCR
jgi:hypothetical protein